MPKHDDLHKISSGGRDFASLLHWARSTPSGIRHYVEKKDAIEGIGHPHAQISRILKRAGVPVVPYLPVGGRLFQRDLGEGGRYKVFDPWYHLPMQRSPLDVPETTKRKIHRPLIRFYGGVLEDLRKIHEQGFVLREERFDGKSQRHPLDPWVLRYRTPLIRRQKDHPLECLCENTERRIVDLGSIYASKDLDHQLANLSRLRVMMGEDLSKKEVQRITENHYYKSP